LLSHNDSYTCTPETAPARYAHPYILPLYLHFCHRLQAREEVVGNESAGRYDSAHVLRPCHDAWIGKRRDTMEIGAIFPQTELSADPGAIREFVQAVEALGYANLFVADHVLER
jgi:hypothetical protein